MQEAKSYKRLCAYLVDLLLVTFVITLTVNIRFLNPVYDKYITAYNIENEINEKEFIAKANDAYYNVTKYGISNNIIGSIIILLYFGVFQKYNKGQTIGKKLMKIKIVTNENNNPKLLTLLLRYTILYLPQLGSVVIAIVNSILVLLLSKNYYFMISNIISTIFIVFSIISYSMIILKKNHQGLHDIIFKTKVINE